MTSIKPCNNRKIVLLIPIFLTILCVWVLLNWKSSSLEIPVPAISKKELKEQQQVQRLAEYITTSLKKLEILEKIGSATNSNSTTDTLLHLHRLKPSIEPNVNPEIASCNHEIALRMLEADSSYRHAKRKQLNLLQSTAGREFIQKPWTARSAGVVLWDFFPPTYTCPARSGVERIGRSGDGGKWVCGFRQITQRRRPCIVYSFGIAQEVSFEEEILKRSNCHVRMYDFSINPNEGAAASLVKKYPNRAIVLKYYIGSKNTEHAHTLRTEMEANGDQFIDILKMDIEENEFGVMRSILTDFHHGRPGEGLLPFGQLQVEVHATRFQEQNVLLEMTLWMSKLEDAGLRVFSAEPNQVAMGTSIKLYEYAFLNSRLKPEYFC